VAAVAAALSGAEVVLLEPGQHLGGMVSGGLGKTDMERQEHFIGGHARRFFEDVGARYGQSLAWRFEPHVAEEIFIELVERAGVEVRLGSMIEDVEMVDTRIGSLRLEDRSIIKAAAYVDACYEGDLLAAAGASFAIGRESQSLNGESLAGRRELLPDPHQFRAPVLASRAGGLTRYLQPLDGICLPGEGDNKIQSYCYRICLTADRANGEPIPPPTGYDAEQYQLLAAYLEALGERATIRDVLGIGELPNGKTDINSGGPISTNLLGASWAYPEADPATRRRVAADHRDWALGLLYFLTHDRAVPRAIRDKLGRYGLPRDEFVATDGWPHQLYVREARRLQGEYVLTQDDLMTSPHKPDSIGLGGYNIDIREVQWVVCPVSRFPDVFDEVLVEGYLSVPVEPYQIPYRALLPRQDECINLLVSTCVSASHVAFSSFRLEPQYMIAGQAAGVAAALASRDGTGAVHDVDIEALQTALRAEGVLLDLP